MKFTTQNGQKEVIINPASFKDAGNLRKAAMKCLLNADALKDVDLNNLQSSEISSVFDVLFRLIINMDTSVEFENAAMECLKECIYDGFYKITPQLFDDKPETREDYYEIVSKCCEENLRPFFKSLISELKTRFNHLPNNIPAQQ